MKKVKEEKIPLGWVKITLGDIANLSRSRVNPQDFSDLPYIGLENIEPHTMKLLHTTSSSKVKSSSFYFYSGDVLYARMRSYLNKVYRPEFEGLCSAEFIVFSESKHFSSKFLQYLINSPSFVAFATKLGTGDRPRIKIEQISDYPVMLPPFLEQQRIVEEIEKQFSRLDEVIKSIKRMQKNLQKLRTTIVKWACKGKLVSTEEELARQENREYESAVKLLERKLNERFVQWETGQTSKLQESGKSPKSSKSKSKYKEPVAPNTKNLPEIVEGWTWATIEQLASFEPNSITDGPFGSNLKSEHYTKEGPRVIRLQNIGDGVFNNVFAHISQEHFENLKKHQVKKGDIVIAALGETLPRACLIPASVGEAIVKADCIRFAPNPELVSNEYINFALNSEAVRLRTTSIVHGVGRPRLNLTEIKAIAIPLPPLEEQKRIVTEVKRRFSVIENLETVVKTNLQRAESLRRKILQDAFAGKLVKQNPNDEPASILLERIKNERAQRESESKRKDIKKPKIMKRKKVERRDIVEVLKESADKMTPEQLFHESGFNPDEVEEFYTELKKADNDNAIEQAKEDDGSVYLTAKI